MSQPAPSSGSPMEPIPRYPLQIPQPRQATPIQAPPAPALSFVEERSPSKRELLPPKNLDQGPLGPSNPWSTEYCYCHDNVPGCLLACFCPCVTFGRIAEILDEGYPSCLVSGLLYCLVLNVTGCPWLYSCSYRKKIRQRYNLEEKPCADCWAHCCCESTALRQEYRELESRGFDPSIGWLGNIAKHRHEEVEMRPPPRQSIPSDGSPPIMR